MYFIFHSFPVILFQSHKQEKGLPPCTCMPAFMLCCKPCRKQYLHLGASPNAQEVAVDASFCLDCMTELRWGQVVTQAPPPLAHLSRGFSFSNVSHLRAMSCLSPALIDTGCECVGLWLTYTLASQPNCISLNK